MPAEPEPPHEGRARPAGVRKLSQVASLAGGAKKKAVISRTGSSEPVVSLVPSDGGGGSIAEKKLANALTSAIRKKSMEASRKKDQARRGQIGEYSVYVWGRGDDFQLGTGHKRNRQLPTLVCHAKCPVRSVACGASHTLMLFEMPHNQEMLVLAWGEGQHGQLGFRPDSTMQKIMPGAIEALAKLQVTKVGAGGNSSWALTADGKLYTWGDNSHQQLGLGVAEEAAHVRAASAHRAGVCPDARLADVGDLEHADAPRHVCARCDAPPPRGGHRRRRRRLHLGAQFDGAARTRGPRGQEPPDAGAEAHLGGLARARDVALRRGRLAPPPLDMGRPRRGAPWAWGAVQRGEGDARRHPVA